jgi:peptidoglycan/LPS O-acetylase OafA/YrhL
MTKLGPGLFRLFLALAVVLHHSTPLRLGPWAVGMFFCLSGYWIAEMWTWRYSLLDRPYVEFMISRWWRLAPVVFFTTLLAGCIIHFGLIAGDTKVFTNWHWWLTQPLIAGSTFLGRELPPAWSLDIEMQFYFIAPLLVVCVARIPRPLQVGLLILALVWCWLGESWGIGGESPRLDLWIGVFLIGMLTSISGWRPSFKIALVSAASVLCALLCAAAYPATRSWILLRGLTGHPLQGQLAATLTVGTILLTAPFAMWTTGLPSSKWDRMLGDLSFPLYLFHWIPRGWYYNHVHPGSRPSEMILLLAINVLTAFAGAVIILLFIDRPLQQLRAKWVKSHGAKAPIDKKQLPVQQETSVAAGG